MAELKPWWANRPPWPVPAQRAVKCSGCGKLRNQITMRADSGGVWRCLATCFTDETEVVPEGAGRRRLASVPRR